MNLVAPRNRAPIELSLKSPASTAAGSADLPLIYESLQAVKVERNRYFLGMVVALLAVVAMAFALVALIPLKEVRPFVIERSGSDPVSVVPGASVQELTKDEALSRFFAAKYVEYREAYNARSVESAAGFVQAMSSADVASSYLAVMRPDNAASPIKIYRKDHERLVTVSSVVFLGDTTEAGDRTAMVRYTAQVKGTTGTGKAERWSALITYTYVPDALVPDDTRLAVNPLGFTVTSYTPTQEWN